MSSEDPPFYSIIKKIGIGFDIFGDYRQESSTEEIFDWGNIPTETQTINGKDYLVPICAEVHDSPASKDDHETCESVDELSNSFSANANAQANIGAFKGEIHAAYSEESHSTVKRYFSYYHHYEESLFLQIARVQDDYLRDEFKQAAGALPTYDRGRNFATYAGFFDHWGTHFIKSCRLGGQIDCDISLEQSNQTTHSDMSVYLKAEYNAVFVSGKVDSKVTESTNWASYHSARRTSVRSVGGKHPPTASDYENPSAGTVDKFNAWLDSIDEHPATLHFQVEGMWKLFHDQKKAAEIERAFWDYVNSLRSSVTVECRKDSCFMVVDGGSDIKSANGNGINVVVLDRLDKTKEPVFQQFYRNTGDSMHYMAAARDLDVKEHHGQLVFVFTSTDTKNDDELPVEFVRVLTECGAASFKDAWDAAKKGSVVRYMLAGSLHDPQCRYFALESLTLNSPETLITHFYIAKPKFGAGHQPSLC